MRRGEWQHHRPCVSLAIAVVLCAAIVGPASGQVIVGAPGVPSAQPVQDTRAAEPSRTSVQLSNDLRPRPLGRAKEAVSVAAGSTQPQTSWTESHTVRTTLALGLVLAVIFGVAAMVKKLAKSNPSFAAAFGASARGPSGLLEVLGRYPLSRGQTLVLLRVDSRVLLIAQTSPRLRGGSGGLVTLCEIAEPEEVASILMKVQDAEGQSSTDRFRSVLERFDQTHPEDEPAFVEVAPAARNIRVTSEGDRAELWDDQSEMRDVRAHAPTVVSPSVPETRRGAMMDPFASPPLRLSGTDAFAELRGRLAHARANADAIGGRR